MADREFEERFEETWNDVSDIEFLRLRAALYKVLLLLYFCCIYHFILLAGWVNHFLKLQVFLIKRACLFRFRQPIL